MRGLTMILAMGVLALTGMVGAQRATVNAKPMGTTTAPSSEYSVNYSKYRNTPIYGSAYSGYYDASQSGVALSPFVVSQPAPAAPPMVLGPVRPYTDEEYARIVISSLSTGQVESAPKPGSKRTAVEQYTDEEGAGRYKMAEVQVESVGDRGDMVLDTQENIRLRGVRIPSAKTSDEVKRFYAKDAAKRLRELTSLQPLYVLFEEPLRAKDGALLGEFYLGDGSLINRTILQEGLGRFERGDFAPQANVADYQKAEDVARNAKKGLWSN